MRNWGSNGGGCHLERHPRQRGDRHAAPALGRGRAPARDLVAPLTERDVLNLTRFRTAIRTELGGETEVLTADLLPEPARTGSAAPVRRSSDACDGRRVVSRVGERCRATVALSVRLNVTMADSRLTMSATAHRARSSTAPEADSLRSTPVGAIWPAHPARDRHLLLWLLGGGIVTAQLAAVPVHGQLRTAQRRLARLVELKVLRGFWAAGAHRPGGRHCAFRSDQLRLLAFGGVEDVDAVLA